MELLLMIESHSSLMSSALQASMIVDIFSFILDL